MVYNTCGRFENLYPEDVPNYVPCHELFYDGRKWRYKTSYGAVRTPNGQYNFVVQAGKIYIGRQQFNGIGGHIDIARGQNVDFAGQIRFGHNSRNRGQIKNWNNASGHYKPSANFVNNTGLPLNRFIPYNFR